MAIETTAKLLRAQVVKILMNSIGFIQSHLHLPDENAQLRDQLSQYNSVAEENVRLRDELSHYQQQSQDNPISSCSACEHHPPSSVNANSQETPEDAELRAEVTQYRERHARLLEQYDKFNNEMKRKKIDSFESLAAYDKDAIKVLIELAQLTESLPLEGNNIGLFGLTSTGKSTMLNALLGHKVAETGVGETTTKITPYIGTKFTLWDVPGRNDEVSYLSMEYIAFFKGLSRRLILIQATVKENSSMMKLLDEIGLRYAIVVNKFDKVEPEEQEDVQKQIRYEIEQMGLKGVDFVYFISAKHPQMFSDWMTMVNYIA